eukprot:TRINITY_DN5699_c0_g1_i10.p1 TRINITY_DN5699_c0_g1~~TRINITY_DN5699_c0_g1_i10.p1  ORF type:complete len:397 (-),score=57.43 TRINITY_DN5699_c0_g1_i10:207-1397(-)
MKLPAALAWEAYGPPGRLLTQPSRQTCARVHGLSGRPELNGKLGAVTFWTGPVTEASPAGRFIVEVENDNGQKESVKLKGANLQAHQATDTLDGWVDTDQAFFSNWQADTMLNIVLFLQSTGLSRLAAVSRGARMALWCSPEAERCWESLLARTFGDAACEAAGKVREGVRGPVLYRTAVALRRIWRISLEVVGGSVATESGGAEVVACPCVRSMENYGLNAQGPALDEAVRQLERPVDEASVTLMPGGHLCQRIAMTVTELPMRLLRELHEHQGQGHNQLLHLLTHLVNLHETILKTVREAGHRSLAMPTLCTGGMNLPAHMVAFAAIRAIRRDFLDNASDPMRVRIACYERDHKRVCEIRKDIVLSAFFDDDESLEEAARSMMQAEPSDSEDTG